jgi:rsbT antagonist protein RsbS
MTEADASSDVARIMIQPYRGALIATIQVDLEESVVRRFQSDLLECIRATGADFAILDISGVEVMDGHDFVGLRRVMNMASLMGTETILCGMQPGVAASLVDLDVSLDDLRTCLNLDVALEKLVESELREEQAEASDEPPGRETVDGSARDEVLDPG